MRGCIWIYSGGGGMSSPSLLLSTSGWRWPIVFSLSSSSSPQSPLHSLVSPTSLSLPRSRKASLSFSPPLFFSFSSSLQYTSEKEQGLEEDEEEVDEHVIGDCLVYEDGIFEDPYLQQEEDEEREGLGAKLSLTKTQKPTKGKKGASKPTSEVEPQSLVPDEWKRAVEEINITKKERRQIARELEYGQRLDRKKKEYSPMRVTLEEYLKYRDEKLSTLQPVVLDNPPGREEGPKRDEDGDTSNEEETGSGGDEASRVEPRNPRWAVYGRGLEDISDFFNSGTYQPDADKVEGGRQKLFTKEEKVLMNAKIPDLAVAASGKWLPLHTVAASGEFYLTTTLLKHVVDINDSDKDGLTALHKAITCKKQAVTNLLLRESANPFVLDKDGATLMHYAVRTASINAIKTLLLYNVSINLQDNEGWSPLHLAVQTRRTDVVKLLLIKGADKTLRNRDGLTPLEVCLYSGRGTRTYELIKLLKTSPRQRY